MPLNKKTQTWLIQTGLFLLTLCTTTLAGAEWINNKLFLINGQGRFTFGAHFTADEIFSGLHFSIPFLLILSCHEFGHYFTAMWHKVKVTLPYYIPLYFGFSLSIGTMGAYIRIKEQLQSKKQYFDVGIAGPLAGFVIALGVLFYGFTHLPPQDHIFTIHPEYLEYGKNYLEAAVEKRDITLYLGNNLLFMFFENFVADPELVPPRMEMYHYPYLFAGYLALFFTALNLIPIGQLDGGHVLYGLIGKKNHDKVSPFLFILFASYAGLGWVTPFMPFQDMLISGGIHAGLHFLIFRRLFHNPRNVILLSLSILMIQLGISWFYPDIEGYNGWLLFAFLIGRVLGVYHPPALYEHELDQKRKILGWIALFVFIICFTPKPFVFETG